MKVKRMVKRLFAVGAGAAMLGATAMGALAADLSSYPDMFVDDGKFNGVFVVGENAKAIDNLAAIDIATSMKTVKSTGTSTTTLSGDSWMVATSAKTLELANNNASSSSVTGETFRDINTFIGEDELGALADGEWKTNEDTYGYNQFLYFDAEPPTENDDSVPGVGAAANRIVKYGENNDDETSDHLFFKSGRQIARYVMEFTSTAQSDITNVDGTAATDGLYLDDFENTDISLMGQSYTVVLARRTSTIGGGAKLTLMGGAITDTLLEGETQTYTVEGTSYEVTLTFVDETNGKFVVNGQSTNKLKVGETYRLSDGSEIGVSEVLYQAYAGGVHSTTFFIGASKMVLEDSDVGSTTDGSKKLRIGSEDIDGTAVILSGSDDNTTFTLTAIEINMTADDDYFVGAGQKLSDVIALANEEKEVLMNGAFDVEYLGLQEHETHDLRLKSSSSRRYRLSLYDGNNDKVDIPVAYAESDTNLTMGADTGKASRTNQKRLILDETQLVYKNDYFVVTGGEASDGSAKSYLMQYRGSDKSTDTSPKIKFKNLGNGETLEYSASSVESFTGTVATIKLGGYSFSVAPAHEQTADNYPVKVQFDGGTLTAANTTRGSYISFVDSYGSEWSFNMTAQGGFGQDTTGSVFVNVTGIQIAQATPDGDTYDNIAPSNIVFNISAASTNELRATLLTEGTHAGVDADPGLTLVTPDGESEVSYGYTSMGAKVTFSEPSGDPDELTISYPSQQALPQVYFTSGATSTSSKASGDMVAVEIVDATKLDSEVPDAKAQNVIAIGGPCANTVAAALLGNPADCSEGFSPGKARIKYWEHANGNVAMLVAGFSGEDTRLAGRVIAHRAGEMTGDEVEVEGTTYSTATIGAPTTVAPAAEPEAETTE